jgi:hypothetical protein
VKDMSEVVEEFERLAAEANIAAIRTLPQKERCRYEGEALAYANAASLLRNAMKEDEAELHASQLAWIEAGGSIGKDDKS